MHARSFATRLLHRSTVMLLLLSTLPVPGHCATANQPDQNTALPTPALTPQQELWIKSDNLSKQGAYQAALESLSDSIRLYPDHSDFFIERSIILTRFGYHESALADAENACSLAPDSAVALQYKAWYLARAGRITDAMSAIKKSRQLLDSPEVATMQAGIYTDLRRFGEAIHLCDQVTKRYPNYAEAYYKRFTARVELFNRQHPKTDPAEALRPALEDLNQAIRLTTASGNCPRSWIMAHMRMLRFLIKADTKSITGQSSFELEHGITGPQDYREKDLTDLNRRLKVNDYDRGAHAERGIIYLQRRQWAPALADFDRTIALGDLGPCTYHNRSRAQLGLGNTSQGIFDACRAVDRLDVTALSPTEKLHIYQFRMDMALELATQDLELVKHVANRD